MMCQRKKDKEESNVLYVMDFLCVCYSSFRGTTEECNLILLYIIYYNKFVTVAHGYSLYFVKIIVQPKVPPSGHPRYN